MEIPELNFIGKDGETTFTTISIEILSYKNIYFNLCSNNLLFGNKEYLLIDNIIIKDPILEIPCKYSYNNKIYNITGFTSIYLHKLDKDGYFLLDEYKNRIMNIDNKVELIKFINFSRENIDNGYPYNLLFLSNKFNVLNTVVINNKIITKNNNSKWKFQN